MPTYEYLCQRCESEFEVEQRITDDPIKTCPSCRSRKVKRLISRTSFVLKGSGWYSDLYSSPGAMKSGDSGAGAPSEGSKPAEGGKSSEGGKESSPASESSPSSSGPEPKTEARSAGKKRSSKRAKAAA